jgi:uncharacterized protein (TIGR03067 family)
MRKAIGLSAGVFLLAWGPLGAADKDDKFDAAKMFGTWTYVSVEKNGQKADNDNIKEGKVKIDKDNITLEGSSGTFVLKYKLDTTKNPVTIDLKITEGDGEGSTAKGIIEVKGDELKLCYSTSDETPKKFESKEGSEHRLVILKRAAAKK